MHTRCLRPLHQTNKAFVVVGTAAHSCSSSHGAQKVADSGGGQSFITALKACTHAEDVAQGKLLHSHIIRGGFEMDPYVENTLIDMYAKCGCLNDALCIFDRTIRADIITWNTIITGFSFDGQCENALNFFGRMHQVGLSPNRITFVCILKACSGIRAVDAGRIVHAYVVESFLDGKVSLGNSLVDLYMKCMSTEDGMAIFDLMSERDIITWSTVISCLCDQGHGEKALHLFVRMQLEGLVPPRAVYFCALKACSKMLSLADGMIVHAQIVEDDFEQVASIGNTLVDMYAKCASFEDAHKLLDMLPRRDVVSWTSMVTNLALHGSESNALRIFHRMQFEGVKPNEVTYLAVIKCCSVLKALDHGRLIHAHIIEHDYRSVLVLGNSLLDMYAKCGSLHEARSIFYGLSKRDAVSWSSMIAACTTFEHNQEALELLKEMQAAGFQPNEITFVSILKLGSNIANLKQGFFMHCHILKHGFDLDLWVGNSLINMYFKCGSIDCAHRTFDTLPLRDVVTWSAMITGYAEIGQDIEAFQLYSAMQQAGVRPNNITFVAILKACSTSTSLNPGKRIHSDVICYGQEMDVCVGNAVTFMYTECRALQDAKFVFEKLRTRDFVTWTIMIAGYAQIGDFGEALSLFYAMRQERVKLSQATFISIFKSCTTSAAVSLGKVIHSYVVEANVDFNISIANSLIHMYCKCGSLVDALTVFGKLCNRDVVTWSTLITALSEHEFSVEAIKLFKEMQHYRYEPNHVTFLSVLKACSSIGNLVQGQVLHAHICENGLDTDISIANTLIDMYAKSGTLINAHKVFDHMVRRDVVSWSVLIEGYSQQDSSQEALLYFGQMILQGFPPNRVTLLSALGACCSIVAIEQGMLIHSLIIESELQLENNISSALLDMYMKCGSCKDAQRIFLGLAEQDAAAWNSMVAGYAQCNDYEMALHYFKDMQKQGFDPDDVACLSLLSACNHSGARNEALHALPLMMSRGIHLSAEHYNCILDLFGRTGNLEEAKSMLETLPLHLGVVSLTSLLGHSRTHGDLNLGESCLDGVLDVDRRNAAGYVLMSIAYARVGMQEEADNLEQMRKHANAWKKPGIASIEVNRDMLDFSAEGDGRIETADAYAKLQRLAPQMKENGYSPQVFSGPNLCIQSST